MPPNDKDSLLKSVDQLNKFVKNLEDRISELKDSTQDRSVKKHRQALEKLLSETQKIIKKQNVTDRQLRDFDRLVSSAEMTSTIAEKSLKNDEEFQQEFKKSQKKFLASLDAVPESIRQFSQTATAKDVAGTSSAFLTGPFGAILKDVAGDVKSSSDTLISRLRRNSEGETAENIKGSYAVGTSSVPEDGIFQLHRGERVVPQDDNERLSRFLDRVSTSSFSRSPENDTGTEDPVEVTFGRNETGIDTQFDKIVEAVTANTLSITRAIYDTGREISEKIGVIQILMSNIGSNFWSNNLIAQQIWWRRFNRHPILNTFGLFVDNVLPALFLPLTATLRALTGSLFSRKKKSIEEESLRALENIQRVLEGREVRSDVGSFRRFFRSITDVPGLLFNKGIKQAQELEGRRGRGEKLTEKEISIIERNIDFITRKAVPKGDDARIVEGEVIRNIDDNVESILDHSKTVFGFDKEYLKRNEKIAKQMFDRASKPNSLELLFEELRKTFGKAKEKTTGSIFGLLAGGGFVAVASKILAGVGAAFAGGNLIGKYIINPLIESLDKTFKTDILGFMGKITTEMLSWFENNIPGFKTFFGTEASESVNRANAIGTQSEIGFQSFSPQVQQRINEKRREKGLPELLAAVEKQTKILQDKQFNADIPKTPSKGGVEDVSIAIQGQGL